jgi:hypothetical protein
VEGPHFPSAEIPSSEWRSEVPVSDDGVEAADSAAEVVDFVIGRFGFVKTEDGDGAGTLLSLVSRSGLLFIEFSAGVILLEVVAIGV